MFLTIISFIFVFGMMVFFHELGHFSVAKFNGIVVNEFAIGIGPKIFGKTKGETLYSVRAFPIGGFVKMEGEDEATENPRGFNNQSPWRRLSVIIAGPLMNFILAVVLLSIITFSIGLPTTVVDEVFDNNPAALAGIQTGDQIISVNETIVENWEDVGRTITESEGKVKMTVVRNNNEMIFSIQPILEETSNRRVIGIVPEMKKSFFKSIGYGYQQMVFIFKTIFSFLGDLISGAEVEGEIIGPVGIVGIVGEAADAGILSLLFIAAYLSVNLGIINLLPFPALDGGRLIFIIFEIVRGKPVPAEKEGFVHFVGFAVLMALMAFVLFKDIVKLF